MTQFNRNPFLQAVATDSAHRERLDVVVLEMDSHTARPTRRKKTNPYVMPVEGKRWGIWSGGLVATVLVHALLVGSLTLGTGKRASRPPENEGFQSVGRNENGTEFVSVLIFVPDQSIKTPEEVDESAYTPSDASVQAAEKAVALASTNMGSAVATPPSLEDFDDSASASKDTAGDGGEAALLFGRYMGQIKARIERAWNFPATPTKPRFQCRAQIRQARDGSVQEITLQQCDMDTQWQMSLVRAIEGASPLSAPPSEKVFSEVVTLSFTAQAQPVVSALVNDNVARNARQK